MKKIIFLCTLMFSSMSANAWIEPPVQIKEVYFEGLGANQRMVIIVDRAVHNCGWNSAAHIDLSVVGEKVFQTYTSVILSSFHASTKVDLLLDGCTGDRARIVALRILK